MDPTLKVAYDRMAHHREMISIRSLDVRFCPMGRRYRVPR
jgi:hypothetical protein